MSNSVEIEAYIQNETERAILVSDEPMGNIATEQWLPKSQARVLETDKNGLSRISCAEWIIIRKGLDALVVSDAMDERS